MKTTSELRSMVRPITPEDMTTEGNRNYDLGRKHRAEELAGTITELKAKYAELYGLVELYLTTPNTNPIIADHYDNLCAWFVRNKRPDGSEPRPITQDQQEQIRNWKYGIMKPLTPPTKQD